MVTANNTDTLWWKSQQLQSVSFHCGDAIWMSTNLILLPIYCFRHWLITKQGITIRNRQRFALPDLLCGEHSSIEAPYLKGFMNSKSQSRETFVLSLFHSYSPIKSQFCSAVVTCAKLWHNLIIIFLTRTICILHEFDYELINLCETAPLQGWF